MRYENFKVATTSQNYTGKYIHATVDMIFIPRWYQFWLQPTVETIHISKDMIRGFSGYPHQEGEWFRRDTGARVSDTHIVPLERAYASRCDYEKSLLASTEE